MDSKRVCENACPHENAIKLESSVSSAGKDLGSCFRHDKTGPETVKLDNLFMSLARLRRTSVHNLVSESNPSLSVVSDGLESSEAVSAVDGMRSSGLGAPLEI